MTWTKEDEQKIRSLILNDDIANVKIGIYLALNTLGMSIDELGLLVTGKDIKTTYYNDGQSAEYQMRAFGKIMASNHIRAGWEQTYQFYLTRYKYRIYELLNEI